MNAQESVAEFDIHKYSDMVLSRVLRVTEMDIKDRVELGTRSLLNSVDDQINATISTENCNPNNNIELKAIIEKDKLSSISTLKLFESSVSDKNLVNFAEVTRISTISTSTNESASMNTNTTAEICRIFLACLMLANLGNLDVIRSMDSDQVHNDQKLVGIENIGKYELNSFSLRLLNQNRNRSIENFVAPSMITMPSEDDMLLPESNSLSRKKPTKTSRKRAAANN